MAEEASNTSNSTQQQGGTGTQTGAEQAQSQQSGSGNSNSRTFTQAEVDEIIKERLQREKSKADKAAEDARRAAEAEAAAKNGEWQKLAEQREKELADARREAREANIRSTALRLGFADPDYGVYLVSKAGDAADAEAVLKDYLTKNPAPAQQQTQQPGGSSSATNPDTSKGATFTRKQIADPVFYQANKQAILQAAREGRILEE